MPRNGSGTFNRLYSWEDDAANNIKIRADRMDAEMDGMATALTNSIAVDGQTPVTANLPMSGFKHTGAADATASGEYLTFGQGGSQVSYDTKSALESANVPASVDALYLQGYTSAGDGGGALYKRVGSEPSHAGKIQSADGAWWEIAESITVPEMFGAVGDGLTNDLPALQALSDYVVSKGGGTINLSEGGEYNLSSGTLFINSDGTIDGEGVDGVSVKGGSKQGSRIVGVVSVGYRDVENADQEGSGGEKQASNSISLQDLEIEGALELYSCQRASTLFNVRVIPTSVRGFYAVFSNTLVCISTRVDNGGNDNDAVVLDTCPNIVWIGGSCNYSRNGFKFVKEKTGSQNTSSPKFYGIILEGIRQISADIRNCTQGKFDIHVVSSIHWDRSNYPLIRMGGGTSGTDTLGCEVSGYVNGQDDTDGDGLSVQNSVSCRAIGLRFSNLLNGIDVSASVQRFGYRDIHFDSSVANNFSGDLSDAQTESSTILPFSGVESDLGNRTDRWENVACNMLHLGVYPVASLPSASGNAGAMIYASDASGGSIPVFSNGSSWLRVDDRTVVS